MSELAGRPLGRRTFLRTALLGAAAAATPAVLGACSRPTGGPPPSAGPAGTLVFAVDELTGNSDPGTFTSFGNWMVIDCVARGLTHIDYRSTEVQPALAESWTVSDDQLTYTFAIREGVTFHDGNALTARDFERSWRRLFDEDDPTRAPNTYAGAELGGDNVTGFRAVDDRTFEVVLAQPDVAFLARCSNPNSVALSSAAIEAQGQAIGDQLVGTGPYRFVSFQEGQSVTLERFEDYWEGAPEVSRVVFQILPDPSSLVSALSSGSVNASCFAPVSNIERLGQSGLVVAEAEPYIDIFLGMNAGSAALSDLRVRQAVNLCLDRQAVVDTVFSGAAALPAGLISPAELGYDEGLRELSTQDLGRGSALLAEAGAQGREVRVLVRNQLFWPTVGQVVEQNLTALGLVPRMEYLDPSSVGERLDAGDVDIFLDQRSAFVPDPDNKLTPLLAGDSFVNEKQTQHYRDATTQARLDELLVAARGEPDETRRAALYVELQRYFAENIMVLAMLAYRYLPTVTAPGVEGINADALGTYRAFFEEVRVA
jgi:peptide/nickel transport system substrate-binding protein